MTNAYRVIRVLLGVTLMLLLLAKSTMASLTRMLMLVLVRSTTRMWTIPSRLCGRTGLAGLRTCAIILLLPRVPVVDAVRRSTRVTSVTTQQRELSRSELARFDATFATVDALTELVRTENACSLRFGRMVRAGLRMAVITRRTHLARLQRFWDGTHREDGKAFISTAKV